MSPDMKIPKGWSKATLGDVATEYSVRVDKPNESGYERFVGSNHIGRFELIVSDWGSTSEVTSAMKVFQPNDYLLVRRSLYASDFRERAARADFAGVCSGDILTIREKKDIVVPGFLSVVLNTPDIWAYIVAHATGSITRRIKWGQLSEYEFALPPLEEQLRIVRLMHAAEVYHETLLNVRNQLISVKTSTLEHLRLTALSEGLVDSCLGEFLEKIIGGGTPSRSMTEYWDGDIPWMTVKDLNEARIIKNTQEHITLLGLENSAANLIPENTIILATRIALGEVAMSQIPLAINQDLRAIQPSSSVTVPFLFYWFQASKLELLQRGAGTTVKGIRLESLKSIPFAPPDVSIQKEFADYLNSIDEGLLRVEKRLKSSTELKLALIREVVH